MMTGQKTKSCRGNIPHTSQYHLKKNIKSAKQFSFFAKCYTQIPHLIVFQSLFFNLLTMSVPGEGYQRNESYVLDIYIYLDLHLEMDNGERVKTKLYDKRLTSFSNSQLPSIIIFQHHQRIEFIFHNSYLILVLVLSTVIFRTELSCSRKSYSSKATLLLD